MITNILYTTGDGKFVETTWDKPDITDSEIEVKAIYTGVCRSDIDMMNGEFPALPIHMSGHEGLGIVTKIGNSVTDVKVGDIVATRGEPAFSDYYNAKATEYVQVPEISPKYIIEPVACAINIVYSNRDEIIKRHRNGRDRALIIGSGFLARVAYNMLERYGITADVVGNHNQELWNGILQPSITGTYDIIIDLSSSNAVFDNVIYNNNALIIIGSDKNVNTNFANMLWKAVTITFPSPRNNEFHYCMSRAVELISTGELHVDNFWSKCYNRQTSWEQAFIDGINRPHGYNRGYIEWID